MTPKQAFILKSVQISWEKDKDASTLYLKLYDYVWEYTFYLYAKQFILYLIRHTV